MKSSAVLGLFLAVAGTLWAQGVAPFPKLSGHSASNCSTSVAARGIAQERVNPMAATVAQSFTIIQRSFVSLADAMPAEEFGFKPTNGEFAAVRTFGEQVKHVACANFAFFNEIEKKEPPPNCDRGGPVRQKQSPS